MLTYDQLDVIADAYIPILIITCMLVLAVGVFKFGFLQKLAEVSSVIVAVCIVYIGMYFDNTFNIWPAFHLDYSTHTALALVFVVYLSSKSKTFFVWSALSFIVYVLLMLYQNYHTVADIASTTVVLLPMFWLLFYQRILMKSAHKPLDSAGSI